jgi:hypothetical protein
MSEEQDVESSSIKNSEDLATLTEVKKYLQKALKRITLLKTNSISTCDLSEVQTESEYDLNVSRDKTEEPKFSNDLSPPKENGKMKDSSQIVTNNISSSNEVNSVSNGPVENSPTTKESVPRLDKEEAKKNTTVEEFSPSSLCTFAQIKVEAFNPEVKMEQTDHVTNCHRQNETISSSDSSSDSESDVEFVSEVSTRIDKNVVRINEDSQDNVDMKLFIFQYRALLKLRKKLVL